LARPRHIARRPWDPMADLRERLQMSLGTAYTLARELGGGGMARVFVARDASLGRDVVVKVLAPELAAGLSAERFTREIKLAAGLQDPHIVPVHAAGQTADGLPYYTMPYVEGESLQARLTEGPVPLGEAVAILRDIAKALAYAHARGIVHRDIKPANVLLSSGTAVVTDFGIAKALQLAKTQAPDASLGFANGTLTQRGTALGTPAYMAPEQAAGDPAVDARADLYAWGVLAYELLAGAPPFAGRAAHQLVAAHIAEPPPPLAGRAPGVPPALTVLVMRCLAKDPAQRPQAAGEVLAALEAAGTPSQTAAVARVSTPHRRVRPVAALLVALSLAALAGVAVSHARAPAAPVRPVLAVLPFENRGPASDAYFADGLTDEVRGRLAGVAGLQVIGGRSVQQYRGSPKTPREIARELGATHVLTGTVRWERTPDGGGRVRVSPELVRAADQASVWAEPVESAVGDVFALQARVADRVATALDVALLDHARGAAVPAPPTRNPAAYDAYLQGLAYANGSLRPAAPVRRAAMTAFARAVALDPRFAAAHARLALADLAEREFDTDGRLLAAARASATRAMALDSTLLETRFAHAGVLAADGDRDGADRALGAAARMAPNNAEVANALGVAQSDLGRFEDAVASQERAVRLEPLWATPVGLLAGEYDMLGRYEDAIRTRDRELAFTPHNALAYLFQASSYLLWRGDTAAARRTLARADSGPMADELTRLPLAVAGRRVWLSVVPPAVLAAKDTLTLAGYLRQDWGTPALYHLMKARHFAMTGHPEWVRPHADAIIAALEPALRRGPGTSTFVGVFSERATLAEAYAYRGRPTDAARAIDAYVDDMRAGRGAIGVLRPSPAYALVTAAYVDVLIGRRDLAVARLDEAVRLRSGEWISRALLRADPWWAPLRGHPGFERLVREGRG